MWHGSFMSKYSELAAQCRQPRTVTPSEAARAAVLAVQSSLFNRLRKARGGPLAGRLSWLLIRASQPDHVECPAAVEGLQEFTAEELKAFLAAAIGARDSLPAPAAVRVAVAVVETLGVALAVRAARVVVGGAQSGAAAVGEGERE